jgi:hypothetical protein
MMPTTLEGREVEREVAKIHELENGDRLTRDEFERQCEAMPELKKADLLEGVVYLPSRVTKD